MVGQVAAAYDALPEVQRRDTVIFTRKYGEAGAIDWYATEFGLPNAYSGHNAYWMWGPPPGSASSVLIVGYDADQWNQWCSSLVVVVKLSNIQGVQDDEYDAPVTLCSGFNGTWSAVWPALKHFD